MRTRCRALSVVVAIATIAACGGGIGGGAGDIDTAMLTRPGGDVLLAGGGKLPYEITSDRYRQWEAARRALRAQRLGLTMQLDPLQVTEADIQRAVTYFERNGRARRAIEGAGMSVRDYVLTTIAVEQQMAVASGRRSERARPTVAATPVTPPPDSLSPQPRDTARRVRVDTVPVVDTVVVPVDTTPPPAPPPDPADP